MEAIVFIFLPWRVTISFPELRSPWQAVGKRELWEQRWASLWVRANVDFVALFSSNRRFFSEIVAFIISLADKCKMWPICAFHDKSMKLGTKLEHILTSVFSYRAIVDLSRDPSCVPLLCDVIKSVFSAVCAMFLTNFHKTWEQSCCIHVRRPNCMISF